MLAQSVLLRHASRRVSRMDARIFTSQARLDFLKAFQELPVEMAASAVTKCRISASPLPSCVRQTGGCHRLCRQARAAVLVHLVHEFARTGPTIGAEALAGALRVSADGRREAALDSLPGPRRRRKVRPAPVVVVIAWDTGFTRSSRTALATPASSGTRSVVMNMQITSAEKTKWRP